MKKYLKITLLVVIAIILVGTFVFLYQKSKPKVITYETVRPEVTDLQKTTVATRKGGTERRNLNQAADFGYYRRSVQRSRTSCEERGSYRQSKSNP